MLRPQRSFWRPIELSEATLPARLMQSQAMAESITSRGGPMIEDGIEYESIGEILAVTYHQGNAETLRELLDHTIAEGIIGREDLESAVVELELVGLSECADIVREAAIQFES